MSLALRSALHLSMNDLAEAQTAAYGGGWSSSVPKLAQICRVLNIDLGRSMVAFDGLLPVGVALVGRRVDLGWIHDIAVAPHHRRGGVASRMMHTVFRLMRDGGIREVELDVAAMREDAIKFYSKLGFQHTRTYLNLEATSTDLDFDHVELPAGWEIVAGSSADLIAAYARAQRTEPDPCWDRSLISLLAYPDGYISRLIDGDHELGIMHYLARPAQGHDPDRLRPLFIALAPGADDALIHLLAATAHAAFGYGRQIALRFALEPENSTLAQQLRANQIPIVATSYDMRLTL
jgi:ribosomal protein S18 acetylase RimI-like enzyme